MPLPFKGIGYEMTAMQHGQAPMDARRMPCSDLEMNSIECYEAYGLIKGSTVCRKFIEDLQECRSARLRMTRFYIMRQERLKKTLKGELNFLNRWGKPYPYDSFVQGTFIP